MHKLALPTLRLNVGPTTFGPLIRKSLERLDEFVGELDRDTERELQFVSKLVIVPLSRLQDDNRVCLELSVQVSGMPWVKLLATIPLGGDGSLFKAATLSLSAAVHKLDRRRGEP